MDHQAQLYCVWGGEAGSQSHARAGHRALRRTCSLTPTHWQPRIPAPALQPCAPPPFGAPAVPASTLQRPRELEAALEQIKRLTHENAALLGERHGAVASREAAATRIEALTAQLAAAQQVREATGAGAAVLGLLVLVLLSLPHSHAPLHHPPAHCSPFAAW